MAISDKSYILNRESDWENYGVVDNFCFEGDNLVLRNNDAKNAYFISYAFDSLQKETIWDRVRIKANLPENSIMRFSAYASDELTAEINVNAKEVKEIVIDDYIKDESIPINDRMHLLNRFSSTVYFDNIDDAPLYALKGRYLWFAVELLSYTYEKTYIESVRIDFPMLSLMTFLPEIYSLNSKPDSFLPRFLGLFHSVYNDINDEIFDLSELFEPSKVDREMLDWLIGWFSVKNSYIWSEEQLRKLLVDIVKLYKIKGTMEAIKRVVFMYTGDEALIVEKFKLMNNDYYRTNRGFVNSLFGDNGYTFTVIIKNGKIKSSDEYLALLKLINLFKPAEAKCNLVVLNDSIYLDYHCYLGISSYITQNKQMILNGDSVMMDSMFLSDYEE